MTVSSRFRSTSARRFADLSSSLGQSNRGKEAVVIDVSRRKNLHSYKFDLLSKAISFFTIK
jgi:hypothetical protein